MNDGLGGQVERADPATTFEVGRVIPNPDISWSHGDLAVVRSQTAARSLRLQ